MRPLSGSGEPILQTGTRVVVGAGVVVGATVVVDAGVVVGATVIVDAGMVVGATVVVDAGMVVGIAVVVGTGSCESAESLPPEQADTTRTSAMAAASVLIP